MNKTIGILAHVDAGKTTFSEQLLYHTKSIRQRGRVDHKNAFLDSHHIEKERGITVFSGQAVMTYNDSNYYLIDTPGHVDFSSEMERAIQVMDYAVIIISAVEGVEGHTETVWQLLREHNIPTFFFINKIDRAGADLEKVLEEIRVNLTKDICDITTSFNEASMSEELVEFIAERDEELLERYMEDNFHFDLWLNSMRTMIKENKLFPCCNGSALQDIGIVSFLEKLDKLTLTKYYKEGDFSGRVYKIGHDVNGTRVTYIKALSGRLKVREELCYGDAEEKICEKITGIRVYNGNKFNAVDEVYAGEIFAVTGLSNASAGDGLGILREKAVYEMVPTLKSKVIFDPSLNIKEILRCFRILEAEDPSLNVTWEESLQELQISVMGIIQLQILEELIRERFNLNVSFGRPEILYKETIESVVKGCGHFEPLGHYAEVHLKLEPGERNSGIIFENLCHPDHLTTGNQNLIGHHIFEREHHGLLTGSPLTDVKITLLTGRAHNKHTSGGDFREAAYRALRQGLEKAKNVLLEPYYSFKIKVSLDHMGRVLSDLEKANGNFQPPKIIGDKAILTGKVPVATFMNYSTELASFTGGKGTLSLVFGGYSHCHNKEEIIEKINYNKNADPEYTSSSIFCSKGQAYVVNWDRAEEEMHCLY
ncbi:TetM/TetW/TetO/TetS family tetracycline resistance ribosomal protection protein [Clostridium sp. A1-XYC3]|uniref:TetM/TetW/TetO/TetS family tetracycline resistance ribosomal protection protein n=1 Tax=Clostridium tanneri TaxID=3037988 RepID=A0ABU4JQL9_9CLOT|nr:translation factor GTPase family protein [Clostridium sp. A1-XYC3]MDW8800422.1 TetM/TetW/TetO/TetS family tetracycline resistance ribosomal protection protein [Clostridium sp. A1-XYC3]